MSDSGFQIAPDGTWMFPPDNGTDTVPETATPSAPGREIWQFPVDDGKTPVDELGPAIPINPDAPRPAGPSSPDIVFPEDKITAPGLLERASNWFTDLF